MLFQVARSLGGIDAETRRWITGINRCISKCRRGVRQGNTQKEGRGQQNVGQHKNAYTKNHATCVINASTIILMEIRLTWDEAKRQINLRRHGLDFAGAGEALNSRYRLDIESQRGTEARVLSTPTRWVSWRC